MSFVLERGVDSPSSKKEQARTLKKGVQIHSRPFKERLDYFGYGYWGYAFAIEDWLIETRVGMFIRSIRLNCEFLWNRMRMPTTSPGWRLPDLEMIRGVFGSPKH